MAYNNNKPTVYNQRKPFLPNQNVKPLDVDKDDGGIYKARRNKPDTIAREIPDNDNMIIDLPIERQIASEVEVCLFHK